MHLFEVRMRLGLFDSSRINPYSALTPGDINATEHEALALRAAQESLTLLENPKGILPLQKDKTKNILVVGPNADAGGVMQGVDCHGVPPFLTTPVDALKNYGNVTYVLGSKMSSPDDSLELAVRTAAAG